MVDMYLSEPKEVYVERRTVLRPINGMSGVHYINKHLHTANWLVFVAVRGSYFISIYNPADGKQVTIRVPDPSLVDTFPRLDIWGAAHWVMKQQWFIHHWTSGSFEE